MYVYVVVQDRDGYRKQPSGGQIKARLEEASGEPCLVVPYQDFSLRLVRELRPRAVAMSGFGGHFQDMEVARFLGMDEVMHQADLPIICFCGSHQLLGMSFNRNLRRVKRLHDEPVRKLGPRDDVVRHARVSKTVKDYASYFFANGFYLVRQTRSDPLFAGLPKTMIMRCAHYCEVKKLPPDFVLLAASSHCAIEAMRHVTRPLYGTQFHPEAFEEPFFHGKKLLGNFARIVDGFWKSRRD
jgi:GMP synthase-like glutamine amidotransferase